jgi:hypothetical protein
MSGGDRRRLDHIYHDKISPKNDCPRRRKLQTWKGSSCATERTNFHIFDSIIQLHTTHTSQNMGVQKKTRKFAQVKRVIGQRDARLKKNQVTGESDQPKKPAEEVVRDMCVFSFPSFLFSSPSLCAVTNETQPTSTLLHVLPTQHRPPTTLLRPSRHKLPLPHRPQQTRTPPFPNGLPLRHLPPHNNLLRNGRTRKTRSKISHRPQNRQRRTLGEITVFAQGNLCRRLYCG